MGSGPNGLAQCLTAWTALGASHRLFQFRFIGIQSNQRMHDGVRQTPVLGPPPAPSPRLRRLLGSLQAQAESRGWGRPLGWLRRRKCGADPAHSSSCVVDVGAWEGGVALSSSSISRGKHHGPQILDPSRVLQCQEWRPCPSVGNNCVVAILNCIVIVVSAVH